MADKYERPAAWALLLDHLEAGLKADAGVAALLTKTKADKSGTYVDVAQGETPNISAPCVRLKRDEEGEQPLTTFRGWGDELPPRIVAQVVLYSQSTAAARDDKLSAAPAYELLRKLEERVLAALRRLFAPEIDLEPILGAPYLAKIAKSAGTDATYWPTVAAVHTITLNKGA